MGGVRAVIRRVPLARALARRLRSPQEPTYEYLFVVTYGRSGSTLLQGILNSIPGYLIRGENHQAMFHLYQMHASLTKECLRARESGRPGPTAPWFGILGYPIDRAPAEYRRLALSTILRPEAGTRVTGYKEIRWEDDDLDGFVDFLCQVFPGARFVVNTRNLEDVSQSKWWADDPGSLDRLRRAETRILALADRLGDRAFHVRYDDYAEDPAALEPLFAWLGEPFDVDKVRATMSVRHSY